MHIIVQICGDTCPGMHTALTFFYKYAQTVIFILFAPLPPFLSLSFLHMRVHTHTHTNTHTHTHTLTHTPHTHTHTPSAGPDALSERCDKMGAVMAGGKYRP